jgi:hypothetical protein
MTAATLPKLSPQQRIRLTLKRVIESGFTSGINGVLNFELEEDGKITGKFLENRQVYDFAITPNNILSYVESKVRSDAYLIGYYGDSGLIKSGINQPQMRHDTTKARKCITGKPCKKTCIEKGRKCDVKLGMPESRAINSIRKTIGSQNKKNNTKTKNNSSNTNAGSVFAAGIATGALGVLGVGAIGAAVAATHPDVQKNIGKIVDFMHPENMVRQTMQEHQQNLNSKQKEYLQTLLSKYQDKIHPDDLKEIQEVFGGVQQQAQPQQTSKQEAAKETVNAGIKNLVPKKTATGKYTIETDGDKIVSDLIEVAKQNQKQLDDLEADTTLSPQRKETKKTKLVQQQMLIQSSVNNNEYAKTTHPDMVLMGFRDASGKLIGHCIVKPAPEYEALAFANFLVIEGADTNAAKDILASSKEASRNMGYKGRLGGVPYESAKPIYKRYGAKPIKEGSDVWIFEGDETTASSERAEERKKRKTSVASRIDSRHRKKQQQLVNQF